jgi:PAS domain S-box-containing protein
MTASDLIMVGSYDYRLVALSVLIAVIAAYAALELAERVTYSRGWLRLVWHVSGALALGIAIWSMHFVGMEAFTLPVPVEYDGPTVAVSLLAGIFASAVALFIVGRGNMGWRQVSGGSILMGGGIAALHYIAMASMRLPPMCTYSTSLVTLSVLLAIALSMMSLQLTFSFREGAAGRRLRQAASALLMGTAIAVMHYTGMAAVSFKRSDVLPNLSHAVSISALGMAGIGIVSLMVIEVALLTSLADRIQIQKALLEELFEQAPQAVALTNVDGQVVRVNREFTRLFGYTAQETIGLRLSELIVPDESRDEEQTFTDATPRGEGVYAQGVRLRKDGSRLDVSMVRVPVLLPDREVAVYAIYHDITERKRADEALSATSEQLRALSASLQSAREEEGTRIARELHDELGSALTSLKWDLESVDKLCSAGGDQKDLATLRKKIEGMIGLIDATINTVSRISSELRPSILDDLGLAAAIEWQWRQFEAHTGIVCQFDSLAEHLEFSREQATAVFRVVQEAMTNILRHANSTRIDITMEEEDGEFVLRVKDNGRGITEEEMTGSRNLGLMGMRERVHLVGGKIEITGAPGKGTVLTVRVPIRSGASG